MTEPFSAEDSLYRSWIAEQGRNFWERAFLTYAARGDGNTAVAAIWADAARKEWQGRFGCENPMKRYLLFAYDPHNEFGGWGDFIDSFHTIEQAKTDPRTGQYSDHQIVDGYTGKVI